MEDSRPCFTKWYEALNLMPVATVVLSCDFEITFSNKSFQNLSGYSDIELLEENFLNLIPVSEKESLRVSKESAARYPNKEHLIETELLNKAGHCFFVEQKISFVQDVNLNDSFYVLQLNALEDKSSGTDEGVGGARLFDLLLENSQDGFWDWHIDKDYEYMSPRFWEMLGYDFRKKKHRPSEWKEVVFAEDLPLKMKSFEQHVSSKGKTAFFVEIRFKHKDGSTVWMICRGKVVEWKDDGGPKRMIGTHTDITKLKKIQSALEVSSKMAAIGQMAGGVAHEINNPLTILNLYMDKMEVLSRKRQISEFGEILDKSKKTISRVTDIVKSLKRVSRNKENYDLAEENIISIIEEAVSLCREKCKVEGTDVIVQPTSQSYIALKCNRIEISQILINLINNSIDAIRELDDKWIKIWIEDSTSEFVLVVQDSGAGIPIEIQEKIMNPFFTTKPVGKGTGFGLSISKAIMERHGGVLTLNDESKNTEFRMIFRKEDETEHE